MNTDESTVKREKSQNEHELPTRSCGPTIPNSKPSEATSSDSGSEPGKERASVTASGKDGKFLRMRLAKALAANSVKGRNFKTKAEDDVITQVRDTTRTKLAKEPTQEIDFQNKVKGGGDEKLTNRAKGLGATSLNHRQSETTVSVTQTSILTSSSPVETKKRNYYSTKTIQRLADVDETLTVSNEKKTHSSNFDWKTLLQARPRNKRSFSRIPVLAPSGGDKGHRLVSDKSTSRKPQETPPAKPDLIRKTSDQSQSQPSKPPATSLSGISPQKGKEISEDVKKRLEHARHKLQKRRSANNKEQLCKGKESLQPNEAISKEATENVTIATEKYSKTKSKVAVNYEKFDALEEELIQFKENTFKTMEEFEDIRTTAKQLQSEIENVRAERLQVFSVTGLKGRMRGTKLPGRNGTQNTADSVYTAML